MNHLFNRRLVYKTLGFFVIWLLLSESYSLAHMGLGLVSSLAVAFLNTEPVRSADQAIRWLHFLRYLPWLFWRIFASGLHLSFLILHPRLPIAPALVRYRTKLGHDPGIVLLGSSITLTPGTVTAEAHRDELIVHAMDDESLQDLQSQRLELNVAKIFRARKDVA